MKKVLGMLLLFFAGTSGLFALESAEGLWKSISDVQGEVGKVTGVWKFYRTGSGEMEAMLVWTPDSTAQSRYKCQKSEFDGKPVLNYPWVKGLKSNGQDSWNGGTLVDVSTPKGEVYGCEIKIKEGGRTLELRGYLGISLFGRTQNWIRLTEAEAQKMKL